MPNRVYSVDGGTRGTRLSRKYAFGWQSVIERGGKGEKRGGLGC